MAGQKPQQDADDDAQKEPERQAVNDFFHVWSPLSSYLPEQDQAFVLIVYVVFTFLAIRRKFPGETLRACFR